MVSCKNNSKQIKIRKCAKRIFLYRFMICKNNKFIVLYILINFKYLMSKQLKFNINILDRLKLCYNVSGVVQ